MTLCVIIKRGRFYRVFDLAGNILLWGRFSRPELGVALHAHGLIAVEPHSVAFRNFLKQNPLCGYQTTPSFSQPSDSSLSLSSSSDCGRKPAPSDAYLVSTTSK